MKKRSLAMILGAAMVMATSFTAHAETTMKLGFTHANPDREADDEVMYAETFKEYVEANSDIVVELYPGSELGSQADTVGAVAAGTVEMTIQNSSQLNNYDLNTMIFGMPGLFTSIEEANKVCDSDWAKGIFDASKDITGIRVLGNSCTGMRSFTCKGHEMKSVEDAKGLTFRVPESAIYIEIVKAIGANPVPMASSEMYVAMQNGVVDGQENPIQNVVIDKTYEVQDWYVLDNHTPTVMSYMINNEFYEGLTEEEQAVIEAANAEAMAKTREVTNKLEAEGIKTLEENGMTVYVPTEEELQGWHDAYGPVCESWMREQVGDELVDGLLEVIAEIRA